MKLIKSNLFRISAKKFFYFNISYCCKKCSFYIFISVYIFSLFLNVYVNHFLKCSVLIFACILVFLFWILFPNALKKNTKSSKFCWKPVFLEQNHSYFNHIWRRHEWIYLKYNKINKCWMHLHEKVIKSELEGENVLAH